jgi:hypothetical protein
VKNFTSRDISQDPDAISPPPATIKSSIFNRFRLVIDLDAHRGGAYTAPTEPAFLHTCA